MGHVDAIRKKVGKQLHDDVNATIRVTPERPPITFNPKCRICGCSNRRDPRHRAHVTGG